MLSLILTATLIAATNAQACTRDYCSICEDHIMCTYPTSDFGARCSTPVYSGLMCDTEKQQILDAHNDVRRRVAQGNETRREETLAHSLLQPTCVNWYGTKNWRE
uniref:SCP-like extracellular protein domain protein n=1 Tax=Coptotermes formosanus TaxID=36987 RepID=R4UKC4_COPFO|nr:SCP-like extracellular protein domain protein [Coptotermes formosanus]